MNLPDSFRHYGEVVLAENPAVVHEWTTKPYGYDLSIPSQSESGFDILFEVAANDVTVFWENGHTHFEKADDIRVFVEELFGLLRDLLSPDMRIRQQHAGGKPYGFHLECFDGTRWSVENTIRLLFWNYFGKRSVKIFSNSVLPGRLARGGAGT